MATPAVGSPGNNRAFAEGTALTMPVLVNATSNQLEWNEAEYVVAQYGAGLVGSALTLPVTIDASHCQFEYAENEYIIPSGVYEDAKDVAHAVNAAIQTGDSSRFDANGLSATVGVGHSLHFTSFATTNLSAFGTGAANDCLTRLGLTDTQALAAVGYPALDLLCKALNASLTGGVTRLDTVLVASPSTFVLGAIRFTAAATGVNTQALGTGSSNDLLASLGFSDGAALDHGAVQP